MDRKNIIVYGWYGHKNIGDEAFKESLTQVLPNHKLTFTDDLPFNINTYDALIVGGGSFLETKIPRIETVTIPIAFVGVGIESAIDKNTLDAISRSKIVIARNSHELATHVAPDLVFASKFDKSHTKSGRAVILLNNNFCPKYNSPEWAVRSWDWFAVEMAQFCDRLIDEQKLSVEFFPMCVNKDSDDRRASAYIIDRMKNRSRAISHSDYAYAYDDSIHQMAFLKFTSECDLIISHRLHGMIFASAMGVPFVGISGHDKMDAFSRESSWEAVVPYYGFSMMQMNTAIEKAKNINKIKPYVDGARIKWKELSAKIEDALFG